MCVNEGKEMRSTDELGTEVICGPYLRVCVCEVYMYKKFRSHNISQCEIRALPGRAALLQVALPSLVLPAILRA